jgi:NAD(P)-dependent dehydrogenase (short-subunit alcohol dehydrogenase family)
VGRLDRRVAIVTGAGSGIGKGITAKFVREGARVVAVDLRFDRVEQTAAELTAAGEVHPVEGDVTDEDVCQGLVDAAAERFGRLDICVNNAGIVRRHPFLEHTRESWDRTIAVNLTAVFLLSQRSARRMVEQGQGGVILSTASANGHVAEKEVAAYNAAKAGVVLLTQTMAIELAPHGIRVNCVSPGYVGPTNLVVDGGGPADYFDEMARHVPLGRIGSVDEIANLFCFLASDEASFISGESVVIDGAQLAEQR